MKLTRGLISLALVFSLSLFSSLTLAAQTAAQDSKIALQRGYRTGYSDGYMSGYRDIIDGNASSYSRHSEYSKADRAYHQDYGKLEHYKDGYRQGFEAGYATGYDKKSFDSAVPDAIQFRGEIQAAAPAAVEAPVEPAESSTAVETATATAEPESAPDVDESAAASVEPETAPDADEAVTEPAATTAPASAEPEAATISDAGTIQNASFKQTSDAIIIIPKDTELIVELTEQLSTETHKEGDKFTAKIVSPVEIAGAIVEGRISKIEKPGRIKKRSQLLLTFDRIVLNETRWANFNAIVTEVLPVKGDNVKRVDEEGTAVGRSRVKDDSIKVGAATGTGAVIGAVAGGPVGAAVGAGVGAAFGVGAVVIERGKHINLAASQQIRIRSSYETQIR